MFIYIYIIDLVLILDKGGIVKFGGSWILVIEYWELNVIGVLRGLCSVIICEVFFCMGVDRLIVVIILGGIVLNVM